MRKNIRNMTNCRSRLCGKFMTAKGLVALYRNEDGHYLQVMSSGRKFPLDDRDEIANVYDGIMPGSVPND